MQNVQNATNAATVADGALSTTTDILQRIRSLAVEASSDITSPSDKADLQTEVSQLLDEVNTIAQNTNFNGEALLDGSHAGFQPEQNAFLSVTANAALASAGQLTASGVNYGLLAATAVAANANFNTTVGGAQGFATGQTGTLDGTIELQVVNTGSSIAVQETFFSSSSLSANPVSVSSQLLAANSTSQLFDNVSITTGNFQTQDVGVTSYIKISQNVAALSNPNSPAFNFQSGANEGDTIQVGFAATNTQSLRISNINLLLSTSSSPSLGAEDAIGQIDNALQTLLEQRANLGAVIVRLNEDADNDNTAAVNLQSSESSIADLNVGAATTEFTKLQVLVQAGTSVLSQANTNAQSVLSLFNNL